MSSPAKSGKNQIPIQIVSLAISGGTENNSLLVSILYTQRSLLCGIEFAINFISINTCVQHYAICLILPSFIQPEKQHSTAHWHILH